MTEPFLQVLFPGQARVCGQVLPPFTFWRFCCLQVIGSPFLAGNADGLFTLADLLKAVRCVKAKNREAPDLRPRLRDLWLLARHGRDLEYRRRQGAAFLRYLELQTLRPQLWQAEDVDLRDITAPAVLSQIAGLMSCGLAHAEAWDTTPGYACWVLAAMAERGSDRVRFQNEADDEINRHTAELDLESEQEVIAQAKAHLAPEIFERWVAARSQNGHCLTSSTDHG